MLYAKFVRAYTHTLRLHMMCTPFLVYTYVIYSYIALYDHYCMIVYFPFYFQIFLMVYTNGIHSLWALHLPGISLEYDILAHVARIFNISTSIHRYILHITEIPTYHWITITWLVLRGILVSLHSWCSPIFTAFILCTPCTHSMCWHCHMGFTYTKRIRLVYLWYTSIHKST